MAANACAAGSRRRVIDPACLAKRDRRRASRPRTRVPAARWRQGTFGRRVVGWSCRLAAQRLDASGRATCITDGLSKSTTLHSESLVHVRTSPSTPDVMMRRTPRRVIWPSPNMRSMASAWR